MDATTLTGYGRLPEDEDGEDALDELVREGTERSPEIADLFAAAVERREMVRELASARERAGLTQRALAARMSTTQSAIARLESSDADPKLSTIERYARAVGYRLRLEAIEGS